MNKINVYILFVLIFSWLMLGCESQTAELNTNDSDWVVFTDIANAFPLNNGKEVANIYIDSADYAGVQKVAHLFTEDIYKVTGQKPVIKNDQAVVGTPIIIGTFGHCSLFDKLINTGKLNVDDV